MLRDYFGLALESLRVRRLRTFLTMIGIFIGIATIVSLISLGQGMKEAIVGQFQSLGSDKITIEAKGINYGPPGTSVAAPLTKDDIKSIERVNGVDVVAGRLIKASQVVYYSKKTISYVVDLPQDSKQRNLVLESIKIKAEQGRLLQQSDKYKIVVGNDYATKETLGRNVVLGDTLEIDGQDFEIVGILKKKGLPFIDFSILMNEDILREIKDDKQNVNMIVAQISKGTDIAVVADAVKKELRKSRNEDEKKETFEISTPEQFLRSLGTVLDVVTAVLIGIAAISLLVGGIGIMNTMYTAVLERTKEIGIMKAIGAKNSDILLIFLIESGLLGLAGGVVGVLLGIIFGKAVEFIAVAVLGNLLLQANISLWLIGGSLAFSFMVGVLSGVLPAMQASKLTPVVALKSK